MHLTNMITAVDAHAAGEPGRVITGGVLDVPGADDVREEKLPGAARRLTCANACCASRAAIRRSAAT